MKNILHGNPLRSIKTVALVVATLIGLAPLTATAVCVGDCGHDGKITVDEIITMVNISLELAPVSMCTAGDPNSGGGITVDEIIQAVSSALSDTCFDPIFCGDGIPAGEECDDGGTCIGGSAAGTACDAESDCPGNGVCEGGSGLAKSCDSSDDCSGGICVHCKTFGGDGCAVNCTLETTIPYNLVPGVITGLEINSGTSGAVVHGDPSTIPLPLVGTQTLIIGGSRHGVIPFVIPSASVVLPVIPAGTLACACVRGVPFQTCGGTVYDADGVTLTESCTPGFTGETSCPIDKPCAFVHGTGNSASGEVACGPSHGLAGINFSLTQDAGGPDVQPGPQHLTISGRGPLGSARLLNTTAIGITVGRCTGTTPTFGPDGMFCTPDDLASARGAPQTLPFTTGEACCTVFNANDDDTFDIGPFCAEGFPVSCPDVLASPPSLTGLAIAGAFPAVDQPTVGDICVVTTFVAQ